MAKKGRRPGTRSDGYGITSDRVFFEATRADKIARIAALDCSFFIDDLEGVLSDPAFPEAGPRHGKTRVHGPGLDQPHLQSRSFSWMGHDPASLIGDVSRGRNT